MSRLTWQREWDPFRDLSREVGRLFEKLEPLSEWRMTQAFPAVNLEDAGDRFIVSARLPGVGPEDVDLSITGDVLTFRGERKRTQAVGEESYRRQERTFGKWTRTITLPERVEGSNVAASFADGMLTITVPKSEAAKPRQIDVKTPQS